MLLLLPLKAVLVYPLLSPYEALVLLLILVATLHLPMHETSASHVEAMGC